MLKHILNWLDELILAFLSVSIEQDGTERMGRKRAELMALEDKRKGK